MTDTDLEYRLVYKRGSKAHMDGADLHVEVDTTGVPPGGVRWQFSTKFRGSKSCYRDVLLESILAMCTKHNVTPVEIRAPVINHEGNFVDVVFAKEVDVLKMYEDGLKFDFYGTQPEPVQRGIPDRKHVALCIQSLPADTVLADVVKALQANARIKKAGQIVDVWSVHNRETRRFNGKVLVLLELQTQNGVVPLHVRAAVPGWFVYNDTAYLVRFPDRPAWCFHCRYDENGSFHSMHACPVRACVGCRKTGHKAIDCPKRQAQVAKKKSKNAADNNDESSDEEDDVQQPRREGTAGRASMERRFAELGIREGSQEAEELARDFGVLALSEDDIGN